MINVEIQIARDSDQIWHPKPLEKQPFLIELYRNMSDDSGTNNTADVIFTVEDEKFQAHRNVISIYAKEIYELSKDYDRETCVPIPNVKKAAFQRVLEYIYTIDSPKVENASEGTELLIAADMCGCINLKLHMESTIAAKFITVENAAEMSVFGNNHTCPLLKEAAMNIISENLDDVVKTDGLSFVKESPDLLTEIFQFSNLKFTSKGSNSDDDNVETMDVTTLRRHLEEAMLEVDGSRKTLVRRLKEYKEK